MSQKNQIWAQFGGRYYLEYPSIEHQRLDNAIYTVKVDKKGNFFLEKIAENYVFDYKIYGLEVALINRLIKTYDNTSGNLGLLLNGIKGTGKTVTCKQIANKMDQPTIVVSMPIDGVQYFLNSIPQDITIFVDEYEKIFGKSNEMLTIMDGAMNSEFRRLFLLTTNKLYIEDNLKERPSRLRYLKEFKDLAPSIVEEIVDDVLEHKELKDECINFMSTLSLITVDIVKEVLNEVNIHHESPFDFGDIFNISKIENRYKIYEIEEGTGKETLLIENVDIYPRPKYQTDYENNWFDINGNSVGRISKVHGPDIVEIEVIDYNDDEEEVVTDVMVVKITKSYGTHANYEYTGTGAYGYGENLNDTKSTEKADKLMGRNAKEKKRKIQESNFKKLTKLVGDATLKEEVAIESQVKPIRGGHSHNHESESSGSDDYNCENLGEPESSN